MSNAFVWLCVILTLVSAFVAYLGDNLGRHVGKRKISIFGLRPRDSAIVVTSVTGGLITLITILVLVLSNATLQTMAKSADEVIRLQREAREKIAESQAQIKKANDELEIVLDQQKALETQIADLDRQNLEATDTNKRLQAEGEEQRQQKEALQEEFDTLAVRRKQLLREIDANVDYILDQETQIAKLRTETDLLTQKVMDYRESDVVLAEGTCVARAYFRPESDAEAIRKGLRALIARAELPSDITALWPGNVELDAAVTTIRSQRQGVDVPVSFEATENALAGGAVEVTLKVLPQAVVFKRGDIIKLWLLDQDLDVTLALTTTVAVISPQISDRAIQHGSVPLMGDRRITIFDSLSLARFAQELDEVAIPAYVVFRATKDIGPFDVIRADENFTWHMLPTDQAPAETTP